MRENDRSLFAELQRQIERYLDIEGSPHTDHIDRQSAYDKLHYAALRAGPPLTRLLAAPSPATPEAEGVPEELPFMPSTDAAKPTEHMVDEAMDGFSTMPATEGLRAQVEHAVERAMWACPVFAPPSKSVWALVDKWRRHADEKGLHYVLKNALLNHAIELDEALCASPPAAQEQKPVAWGLPNSAITGKQALLSVALEVPSDDQYGGALWVPLFAFPIPASGWVDALCEARLLKAYLYERVLNSYETGAARELIISEVQRRIDKYEAMLSVAPGETK